LSTPLSSNEGEQPVCRSRLIDNRKIEIFKAPAFLLEPYTDSATIFFGTIAVVVMIGACVPLLFGKETVGQLEMVTEAAPELGKA
jgi:hypothetical protein